MKTSGKKRKQHIVQLFRKQEKKSSDAQLVDLYGKANEEGESDNWYAEFISPSQNSQFKVVIANGQVTEIKDQKISNKKPIGETWVDSDKIIKEAVKNCGSVSEKIYFMSLDNKKDLLWSVNCTLGENKTLVVVMDGLTGEFKESRRAGILW